MYNYLSGSSVDNQTTFLYDALSSGECYLGFTRGTPENQWSMSTLISIQPSGSFPSQTVATSADVNTANKFFDFNSLKFVAGATDVKRKITIRKYANSDTGFTTPLTISGFNNASLYLSYVNKDWAVIQGLQYDWYNYLTYSATASYYIINWNNNTTNMLKILPKAFANVPYYSTKCKLLISVGGTGVPYVIKDNLERITNILGETYVAGLNDPVSINIGDQDILLTGDDPAKKTTLENATFTLQDYSVSNTILISGLTFVDPTGDSTTIYQELTAYGNTQKSITFKYSFGASSDQYINFIVGNKQINELGIWNEQLPFSTLVPVADANPPALDVSYLRNPTVNSSIFDVNGLIKINPATSGEVMFVRECFNSAEVSAYQAKGFTVETITLAGEDVQHTGFVRTAVSAAPVNLKTINMQDYHTFVVGDTVFIPYMPTSDPDGAGYTYTIADVNYAVGNASITFGENIQLNELLPVNYLLKSAATTVAAKITLAKTSDSDKAIKNGFFNVLISKTVDLVGANSPTENVYRQLVIAYKPKDRFGVKCSSNVYNGDAITGGANFNASTWEYDNGLILYIANKISLYRKWAINNEEFKIII